MRSVLLTRVEFGDPVPAPGSSKQVSIPLELSTQLDTQVRVQGIPAQKLAVDLIANALRETNAA